MRKLLNHIKSFSSIFALTILSLLVSFTVLSCENSFTENKTEVNTIEQPALVFPANKGAIKIGITTPKTENVRTAMPEMNLYNLNDIKLTGTFKGENYQIAKWSWYPDLEGNTESYFLEVGTWSLTISANYNGFNFSDTKSIIVTEATSQNISFKLSPETTTGGLSYYIDFSTEKTVDHVDYEIKKYPSGDSVSGGTGTLIPEVKNEWYNYVRIERNSDNALENGTYRIIFKFYGGAGNSLYLNTYSEILRITGGITTRKYPYLDLNDVYKITWNTNGGTLKNPVDSLVEQYSIHSDYTNIKFPELEKNGNKWGGWYTTPNPSNTDSPITEFPSNQIGDVEYWAKWIEGHKLSYVIVNSTNQYPISDALAEEYNLPLSHDEDDDTDLSGCTITDGSTNVLGVEFYNDSSLTNIITDSKLEGSSITEDKTIYIKLTDVNHVYVDPEEGVDYTIAAGAGNDKLPFNLNTPAKTVAYAKEWLKNANSSNNPVLYVKSSITRPDDVSALSNLSKNTTVGGEYGGAIVKRYSTFKNAPVINLTSGTVENFEWVTIDGGAEWGTLTANTSVRTGNNSSGLKVTAPLITVASGASLDMKYVYIQNNDNTGMSGTALNVLGTVKMQTCQFNKCKSSYGGAVNVSGSLTAIACHFNNNYATTDGGALKCGANSNVSISGSNFIANESANDGGAIYNSAVTNPLVIDGCYFENNNNSNGTGGTNIYDSGYLKLAGSLQILDGDIYFDVPVTNPKRIILAEDFTCSNIITIVPYQYNNTKIFDLSELTTDTQKSDAVDLFELDTTDYEITIVGNEGIIKPKPGIVTVTPGFPGTYSCGYTLTKNGSDRTINLVIKDTSSGTATVVDPSLINSLKVTLYETGDAIKTWTGTSANNFSEALEFTYPSYLDDPTDTSFYVEVSIKPTAAATVAYSYDFYAVLQH